MVRKLLLYLILTIGISGCATPIDLPIGVIPRPHLIPISVELLAITPLEVIDTCAVNYEVLKNHIKRYESRVRLHDESLE